MDNDQRTKTFDVRKYKLTFTDPTDPKRRVPLESFTLRETTGEDDIAATERALTSGNAASAQATVKDNLIADAFVAVNGDPVVSPFIGWRKWPSKTRDYVGRAFRRFNDASEADLEDFEKAAFGEGDKPERG